MNEWKLLKFFEREIKYYLDIDGDVIVDTDGIDVELDGDSYIMYCPIEYREYMNDWTKISVIIEIYPDFTFTIKNNGRVF